MGKLITNLLTDKGCSVCGFINVNDTAKYCHKCRHDLSKLRATAAERENWKTILENNKKEKEITIMSKKAENTEKKSRARITFMDKAVTAGLRWFGANGYSVDDARRVMAHENINVADSSITSSVNDGKREDMKYGKPADFSPAQEKTLKALIKKLQADAPAPEKATPAPKKKAAKKVATKYAKDTKGNADGVKTKKAATKKVAKKKAAKKK